MAEETIAQSTPSVLPVPTEQDVGNGESDAQPAENGEAGATNDIFVVPHTDETIPVRVGTTASARFNILSTMVGGGCLSLPLAFQQSGNALLGPIVLILTGLMTDFCFRLLVAAAVHLKAPHPTTPGKDSFESITSIAFGPKAYVMSMGLVTAMCFFGAVGYSVLLRDMLTPLNDWLPITSFVANDWLHKNFMLFTVILIVTPACTLTNFTSLQKCGAASMTSILVLGTCIVIRSVQCNISAPHPFYTYLTFWPESPRELLDALPLYISCFVCHYNILPVHNELKNPTPERVSWWLRSTTWFAVSLYMIMGLAGSSYGHCTASGKVQGNVLLDFDENDPLLMVGRMCLALTITLAFPLLVIPARDIMLRSVILPLREFRAASTPESRVDDDSLFAPVNEQLLHEPLLMDEERVSEIESEAEDGEMDGTTTASFSLRLGTSIGIFWTAGLVASCVASIDIVWDLLGSSLSILLSYLIPCGCYLVIMRDVNDQRTVWSKRLCWLLICIFVPLMIISTANAIDNTFFH